MDALKDRFFILVRHKGQDIPERLPLASRRTLFRVFIHLLMGDINSCQVWNEEFFDRKVVGEKERINGKLIRKSGITLRHKTIDRPYLIP